MYAIIALGVASIGVAFWFMARKLPNGRVTAGFFTHASNHVRPRKRMPQIDVALPEHYRRIVDQQLARSVHSASRWQNGVAKLG
jgi:hypothetical protein